MPRYFFQISHDEVIPDFEGTEMSDLTAARCAAVDIAAGQLKGNANRFWTGEPWRLEVSDDTGDVVIALTVTTEFKSTS